MKRLYSRTLLVFFLCFTGICTHAQEPLRRHILDPADSLDRVRFWTCAAGGAAIYGGFSVALYNAWYKGYELTGFHTFDDFGEWHHMDKAGHLFTTYMESNYAFRGALWTGMDRRAAMWTGAGVGMLLQTTVEVMDGFSAKWGFSWSDMAFNVAGAGLFVGQEMLWADQRILMKASVGRPNYSDDPIYSIDGKQRTSLAERARELYGTTFAEAFLKEYNALTLWASANVHSFLPKNDSKFPRWLNVSVGYGAENLFGGFANEWEGSEGAVFRLDPVQYPRYQQFYLSFDVDLTRIRTKSRVLKLVLGTLNWIKIPSPTLEVNTLGQVKFHPLFW
jgi:hypothetical protein